MARDPAAQRTDYSNRSSEHARGKEISSKPMDMIRAGGAEGTSGSGPTGSSRVYPKGGSDKFKPDFNPQVKSDSSGSDWAVGGV